MLSIEDQKNILNFVKNQHTVIQWALYSNTGHMYWKIQVLPSYDNKIGGYNLQIFASDVVNRNLTLDRLSIGKAKSALKELPFISKVRVSPVYNSKLLTVLSVGLKAKSFLGK